MPRTNHFTHRFDGNSTPSQSSANDMVRIILMPLTAKSGDDSVCIDYDFPLPKTDKVTPKQLENWISLRKMLKHPRPEAIISVEKIEEQFENEVLLGQPPGLEFWYRTAFPDSLRHSITNDTPMWCSLLENILVVSTYASSPTFKDTLILYRGKTLVPISIAKMLKDKRFFKNHFSTKYVQ